MRLVFHSLLYLVMENWLIIASIFSIIWGIKAVMSLPEFSDSKGLFFDFIRGRFAEFVLHFVFSFTGWLFLHILYVRFVYQNETFGYVDIALVLLAAAGITDQLPKFIPDLRKRL
ncbi:MAG: hypothetical protein JW871_00180 [Endomicrobiales bacterium]|nr:hypothetical protein [Endomicrobiales bacterium]